MKYPLVYRLRKKVPKIISADLGDADEDKGSRQKDQG
jgi:hypothetical protein